MKLARKFGNLSIQHHSILLVIRFYGKWAINGAIFSKVGFQNKMVASMMQHAEISALVLCGNKNRMSPFLMNKVFSLDQYCKQSAWNWSSTLSEGGVKEKPSRRRQVWLNFGVRFHETAFQQRIYTFIDLFSAFCSPKQTENVTKFWHRLTRNHSPFSHCLSTRETRESQAQNPSSVWNITSVRWCEKFQLYFSLGTHFSKWN